eukprot:SAG31_NODE_6345_length_2055_cov_1.034765_2_plen_83_part_00
MGALEWAQTNVRICRYAECTLGPAVSKWPGSLPLIVIFSCRSSLSQTMSWIGFNLVMLRTLTFRSPIYVLDIFNFLARSGCW